MRTSLMNSVPLGSVSRSQTNDGCPISRSFFARCGIPLLFPSDSRFIRMHLAVNIGGIPYLAKNERDTRIFCTQHQATATCAAFVGGSRMKFINANKLHRKSGGTGHPALIEGTRGTRPTPLWSVPWNW